MKVCRDVEEWIQENVEQDVEKQEQRCKDWPWPLSWFCSIVTFIVKIVVVVFTKIIRVVCEIVNVIANAIAALFNLVLTIPILGPAIKALIRVFTAVLSYVVGLVDGLGRLIGIRITKHLQVHVIPLCEGVVPLANVEHLTAAMTETARILYARAQIRVHTTFHEPILNPPENALRVGTGVDLIVDEAWLKGSWHQLQTIKLFEANFWSLIGLGQPVIVYVVREVGYDGPGTVVGASGGFFTDWVAVERDSVINQVAANAAGMALTPLTPFPPTVQSSTVPPSTPNVLYFSNGKYVIAHEICHSLGLLGHSNSGAGDLMAASNISGDALSPFQVGIIRNSAHVTFV